MSLDKIEQELLDGNCHEESVDRILDHYQSMQTRLKEGEYDEAGSHIGNFCENVVNLLRDQMGRSVQERPKVGAFIQSTTDGKYGGSEPDSIRLQVPRTLRAAYDIRNNRDSVHTYLEVPVNHADTQAGVAMCSWMLAEIVRVYGSSDDVDDMETVGDLIEEISEPVQDGNPLEGLMTTSTDFDRESLLSGLNGTVLIVDHEVRPDQSFTNLSTSDQIISLLLGRRAAVDLDELEDAGATREWLSQFVEVTGERVRQIVTERDFVRNEPDAGGYHIPGYRVEEALKHLSSG